MKANGMQKVICRAIRSQCAYWICTNDITSPTHLVDIEEYCCAELESLIPDKDREELQEKLKDLYWFIRKFDTKD